MNLIQKRLATGVASASLLLNVVAPVLAQAQSYEISGNNTGSSSYVDVSTTRDTHVDQNNDANVNNSVTLNLTTGDTHIDDVAGGDVSVDSGNVSATAVIQNQLNNNVANVATCDSCGLNTDFKISGNNTGTDNDIKYRSDSDVRVDQDNDADVNNDIDLTGNSAGTHIDDVVGGDINVSTGDVTLGTTSHPVAIVNKLNSNFAWVGGGDSSDESSLSAWITGNNTDSDNFINVKNDKDTNVDQDNDANVKNDVAMEGKTGNVSVDDFANGEVSVDTGDVDMAVYMDTMANFNWANVEDCCLLDLSAKIANNNSDTDNDIAVKLGGDLDVDQDNDFSCKGGNWYPSLWFDGGFGGDCNDVDMTGSTGGVHLDDGVAAGEDPSVDTGNVGASVGISTEANVNSYGADMEDADGGTSVDVNIDFSELLSALNHLIGLLS